MATYIHYGHDCFSKEKLVNSRNSHLFLRTDKPEGLWASPIDAQWGWKDWCKNEDYKTDNLNTFFSFTVKEESRILHIHSLDDAEPYIRIIWEDRFPFLELKLDKIYGNFDAMQLHISDNYNELHNNQIFYTWDVDSICIWNPDIIIPV